MVSEPITQEQFEEHIRRNQAEWESCHRVKPKRPVMSGTHDGITVPIQGADFVELNATSLRTPVGRFALTTIAALDLRFSYGQVELVAVIGTELVVLATRSTRKRGWSEMLWLRDLLKPLVGEPEDEEEVPAALRALLGEVRDGT